MSSKSCEMWMSNNAGTDTFQFPVLPSKLSFTHDSKNDTVDVSGLGEITILQSPAALTISWDCHFPAIPHQGCIASPLKPNAYVAKIKAWQGAKKPVKFLITGTKINDFFSIESFSYYEQGGDPDTLYYTIKLKSYKEVAVRKLEKAPTIARVPTGGSSGVGPANYQKAKVKTKGSRMKLYKEASKSSKVVKKISNKSTVHIISQTGSWYYIVYPKSKKEYYGYAQTKYVKISN